MSWRTGSGLVNTSAAWSCEDMNLTSNAFIATLFLTKWKSIYICFVQAWNTEFDVKYVTPRLSHHKHGALGWYTPSSASIDWTHTISAVAFASTLYSVFVLDRETSSCFLALHDMRFVRRNTTNPPVDRWSSRQSAQLCRRRHSPWLILTCGSSVPCPC